MFFSGCADWVCLMLARARVQSVGADSKRVAFAPAARTGLLLQAPARKILTSGFGPATFQQEFGALLGFSVILFYILYFLSKLFFLSSFGK